MASPVTLLLTTLLLLLWASHLPAIAPIEPSSFLNIGSPAAIQAALGGWRDASDVPLVLIHNASDACSAGFVQSMQTACESALNFTLRPVCVHLEAASIGPASKGLFLFILPVDNGAPLAWPVAQLFLNASQVPQSAALALSHDSQVSRLRPCDAPCRQASGLLHFPHIAQYHRIPHLHVPQQDFLAPAVAQYLAAALMAPPEVPLRPSVSYFSKPHGHHEPQEYTSLFPSRLYIHLTGISANPPKVAGWVYHGHQHLHRLAAVLREARGNKKLLTVTAIGSSFTFGVGLKDPRKQTYCALLNKALHDMGIAVNVVNQGKRGGAPPFFATCGRKCIPAQTKILLVEFAVSYHPNPVPRDALEELLRRFANTAIIFVGVFQQYKHYWFANDNANFALAHHYGIPVLSMRSVAYHSEAASSHFFKGASGHHFGVFGHRMIAGSLADLFKFAEAHVLAASTDADRPQVPFWSVRADGPDPQFLEHDELSVVACHGWTLLNGTRPGWIAVELGSTIVFDVTTGNVSEVTLIHLVSYENIGNCSVWFDDDQEHPFSVSGSSADPVSILHATVLPVQLATGRHTVTVNYTAHAKQTSPQLQYGFRIAGIGWR